MNDLPKVTHLGREKAQGAFLPGSWSPHAACVGDCGRSHSLPGNSRSLPFSLQGQEAPIPSFGGRKNAYVFREGARTWGFLGCSAPLPLPVLGAQEAPEEGASPQRCPQEDSHMASLQKVPWPWGWESGPQERGKCLFLPSEPGVRHQATQG